ncbi:MAG TPA: hypothetical protein PLH70_00225 [Bacteroidales bacterium]|nr:hypothetical protein [Bacteroidales bacterium]HOH21769.1 hypothetical protein [Bacteroidales bacterium]HPB58002.1 hypothetical protein [Bacteroidales bacterium]HPZ02908.1 hypothetical protein [Bacteroidales bacterium]HQB74210.1 hypothetical protein [Bacteroidales bacterium]
MEEIKKNDEKKTKEENKSWGWGGRIIGFIIVVGIGLALFYFGSWHLILGIEIDAFLHYLYTGQFESSVILDPDGFLFRINEKYYGFVKDGHFFDSPLLQWIMLFLSMIAFIMSIYVLFSGIFSGDDDDDNDDHD